MHFNVIPYVFELLSIFKALCWASRTSYTFDYHHTLDILRLHRFCWWYNQIYRRHHKKRGGFRPANLSHKLPNPTLSQSSLSLLEMSSNYLITVTKIERINKFQKGMCNERFDLNEGCPWRTLYCTTHTHIFLR